MEETATFPQHCLSKMDNRIRKLSYIAIFAAINYVVFTFAKINIPLAAGSHVAIHLANACVVLSSWLLGPVEGGIAGAIGLSIADLLDPRYITSAPKTFFLKFMIAFIAGKLAQRMKLREQQDPSQIRKITLISAACALVFNVIFDPIIGYLYKKYLLKVGAEAASIILAYTTGVTALNAFLCTIAASLLYQALYKGFHFMDQ